MTRLAKAMSAFTFGRVASVAAGRGARSFTARGVSSEADGSGAPSHGSRGLRAALGLALLLSGLVLAFAGTAGASKVVYDSFGSAGASGGQFTTPRGVAVNATGSGGAAPGDVYVVDAGNSRIQQFSAAGAFIRAFGRDVITTGNANDNAAGYEICDTTAGNVAADCKAGVTTPAEGGTLTTAAQGMAINQATGHLYVSNQGLLRIEEFDATGHFVRAFGQDVVSAGPGNAPATAAKQTLTVDASAGQYKLTFRGQTTADIEYNAPATGAGSVQTALQALSTVGAGNATVTGGPGGAGGGTPYVITFAGTLNNAPMAPITAAAGTTPLSGGAGASVANTTTGATGFEVCNAPADTCKAGVSSAAAGAFAVVAASTPSQPAVVPGGPANAGNVVAADPGNRRVNEYTSTGAFVRSFGFDVVNSPPNATTTFEVCNASAFDVCKIATASGTAVGQFGTNTPGRVAVDTTGAIFAVEQAGPNFRVQKFTPAGSSLTPSVFAAPILSGSIASPPTDIAVNPANNEVYVVRAFAAGEGTPPATVAERRILQLDPAGALLDTHMAGAAINSVNGLALNPSSGHIYVTSITGGQLVYVLSDPPDHAPSATTGVATTGAADDLITFEGTVNPAGFKVKDCYFEYGTSTAYGAAAPCAPAPAALGAGNAEISVSASSESLELGTTYHFRLHVANAGLGAAGADRTFSTPGDPACPNAGIRAAQGIAAVLLPSCMALELVNPPRKASQPATRPQVSADGERVLFLSPAGLDGATAVFNALGGDPYVASRDVGEERWETAATTSPDPTLVKGWETFGQARSFTPDLSRWFFALSRVPQSDLGITRAFEGGLDGTFSPLSPLLTPSNAGTPSAGSHTFIVDQTRFRGASTDHSRLFLSPGNRADGLPTAYLPGDPVPAGAGFSENTYVVYRDPAGSPSVELLARDGEGKVWGGNCGTRLGGSQQTSNVGTILSTARNQGAVSADGARAYFSTRASQPASGGCSEANKMRILRRLETAEGPWITELIKPECNRPALPAPPGPCSTVDGSDNYQGASVDGTRVYFTTNRQLANSDLDGSAAECSESSAVAGCDLYLYDSSRPVGQRLTQVSAGETVGSHEAGKEAKVLDLITAISGDGSHAYFVAEGALTGPNAEGKSPSTAAGARNLYLYERDEAHPAGRLVFVGAAAATDQGDSTTSGLWGGMGSFRNGAYPVPVTGEDADGKEIGGDGHVLLFQSKAALTADDTDGGFLDIFRYDAGTGQLERVSKAAPGGADGGAFNVTKRLVQKPSGTDFAEEGRWASEDGRTVAFATAEGLVPGDINGATDFYLWREGRLARLPGVVKNALSEPPFLSHDGATVAFVTTSRLLPEDGDATNSVYVARAGGGFAEPATPVTCAPDGGAACQGTTADPPSPSPARSVGLVSAGNVPPARASKPCRKGTRRIVRKGKPGCVKKAGKRKKRAARKRAGRKGGGSR